MSEIKFDQTGVVFDIQRYSIHDGPGIRTIVFLKGCPLACRWCCNPESQALQPTLMYQDSSCIHCGRCLEACKYGALSRNNPGFVDRSKCVGCGACAEVCPTDALTLKGKRMTVWEVMQELRKDATNYRRSGGGMTLSGGEPLGQPDFARELLKACREQGWNTAMETTGQAPKEVVEDVIPHVDHALCDLKSIDPAVHRASTGVDNRQILENALRIASLTHTVVRVPTVPGVNADPASMEAIGRFALRMPGVDTVHILPYHTYGENKYALLNREYPMGDTPSLSKDAVATLKGVIEGLGLACVIGG
ncbi:glycyl-radical enzyme activating protein [Roseospira marina]|uniref:Glycyl-radical enzyme activating protein n=1 Tax=Roseospira marina TaxID=140057 RepID=A0A5M6IHM2_9PROT|nr:glycyl-radical enzyme activating protein [Roseospira marina]KAA5607068.1 glycyl-radical enzyme activating protein [Roseospira marina]MBB4312741.1 pyruvate formate lyase activating enzyme [Roseospira marina]MBB5086486.1 pyruvate formate lyase activating enzyme [Roseospira marina]